MDDNLVYYWRETPSNDEEDGLAPIHAEPIVAEPAEAAEVNLLLSISLDNLSKIHIKHSKEQLAARRLSLTGVKSVLLERLKNTLNDNVPIIDELKIVTLLPIPRIPLTSINNNAQRAATGSAVPTDVSWILLEPNDEDTTTATNNFNSHNLMNLLGININSI